MKATSLQFEEILTSLKTVENRCLSAVKLSKKSIFFDTLFRTVSFMFLIVFHAEEKTGHRKNVKQK